MLGRLDTIQGMTIIGWAYDPAQVDARISVEIRVDDQPCLTVVADQFRGDLQAHGIGDGRHAFRVELPASLADGQERQVCAGFVNPATGGFSKLDNCPQAFCRHPETARVRGKLERIADMKAIGWAHNPDNPQDVVALNLFVMDQLAGKSVAGDYRSDLQRAGMGNGWAGFRLPLPSNWLLPEGAPVGVCYSQSGQALNNSPVPFRLKDNLNAFATNLLFGSGASTVSLVPMLLFIAKSIFDDDATEDHKEVGQPASQEYADWLLWLARQLALLGEMATFVIVCHHVLESIINGVAMSSKTRVLADVGKASAHSDAWRDLLCRFIDFTDACCYDSCDLQDATEITTTTETETILDIRNTALSTLEDDLNHSDEDARKPANRAIPSSAEEALARGLVFLSKGQQDEACATFIHAVSRRKHDRITFQSRCLKHLLDNQCEAAGKRLLLAGATVSHSTPQRGPGER